jgi:Flp pilus assembly pilin Flp
MRLMPPTGRSRLRRPLLLFEWSKGGEPKMKLSDWFAFARMSLKKEEGQTMAEYGVILAVITVGIVVALTALSGGIQDAIGNVVDTLTP